MGGSSGSQQVQNTSSTSTTGPHPQIAGKLASLSDDLWQWYARHGTAPAYYPGGTVAPPSARSVSANTALWQRGAGGLGYGLDAAARQATADTIGGKYLDVDGNPYLQKALEASFRPQAEQLRDIVLPTLEARFSGAGRGASGAHRDTALRALEDMQRAQSDAAAKAAAGIYTTERGNQQAAIGLLPAFQNMDYQNLMALRQAGAADDAHAQRLLDDRNARYDYDNRAQADWYARIAQLLQSIYPGTRTSGNSTAMTTGSSTRRGLGDAIGTGLGIARLGIDALGLPGTPLFGLPFSDRRLKSDIEPVGRTFDGQNVYRYRLLGEPHHRLGLMAQEVEARDPAAVVTDASGFKRVDYARATERAVPVGGLL
jgi:hypothetical protein